MAENKENLVSYRLPLLSGANAPQEEFVSLNFKTYRIKRGVDVKIPQAVKAILEASEKAREEEILAKQAAALREPGKPGK